MATLGILTLFSIRFPKSSQQAEGNNATDFFFGNDGSLGIYPDLLHIVDLQILHDVISSTLQEISAAAGRGHSREARLQELRQSYMRWCTDMGSMALDRRVDLSRMFFVF